MTHAYFTHDGALLRPDRTARGPWSDEQQSGLAITGLLTRAIEAAPSPVPMRLARLTMDFLGAVPMRPTEVNVRVLREGKRLQVVEAELRVEGAPAAMASGVRVCLAPGPSAPAPALGYPGPEETPPDPVTRYFGAGHPLETRVLQRAGPGGRPGVFWARFNTAFVAGEPTSGAIRACMTADIATGVVATGEVRGWRYPNADLSIYFAREPVGVWQMAVSRMDIGPDGMAITRSTLADETGVFGYGRQTLVMSKLKQVT